MRARYDADADALSLELRQRARRAKTIRVTPEIRVDLDAEGRAVSIEILNAAWHLGRSEMTRYAVGSSPRGKSQKLQIPRR